MLDHGQNAVVTLPVVGYVLPKKSVREESFCGASDFLDTACAVLLVSEVASSVV